MKVRGTIASINLSEKTIRINFKDVIEVKSEKLILMLKGESLPLKELKNCNFDTKSLIKMPILLLVQLFNDKILLIFEVETKNETENDICRNFKGDFEGKITDSKSNKIRGKVSGKISQTLKKYEIKSIELINE